jgi:dimethylhistidine N-methyltransferase
MGFARRLVRHAVLAYSRHIPKLFPARSALAIFRLAIGAIKILSFELFYSKLKIQNSKSPMSTPVLEAPVALANLFPPHNCAPEPDDILAEVLKGLRESPKGLPCKYFYDARGSRLFDAICELPEYYPTRVEISILENNAQAIAEAIGKNATIVEYGSGTKTHLLLKALYDFDCDPAAYVPIDIARSHLLEAAENLAHKNPDMEVLPVCADYTHDFSIPAAPGVRRVAFFPGSTIGNFIPENACRFLSRIKQVCGEDAGLLIGVDLKKSRAVLESAYNDSKGITAQFNLNLLTHINRALGSDFDLQNFRHVALYNEERGRIEMHIESMRVQKVRIGDEEIPFQNGERIHTENSYKYSLEEFAALANAAGWQVRNVWQDDDKLFSVQYLSADL